MRSVFLPFESLDLDFFGGRCVIAAVTEDPCKDLGGQMRSWRWRGHFSIRVIRRWLGCMYFPTDEAGKIILYDGGLCLMLDDSGAASAPDSKPDMTGIDQTSFLIYLILQFFRDEIE